MSRPADPTRTSAASGENRVVVDFDGTLVTNAWPEIGEWNPGAIDAVKRILAAGYDVVVFSTRLAPVQLDEITPLSVRDVNLEVAKIRVLLNEAGLNAVSIWRKPWKPGAVAYIDDKAIHYAGDWRATVDTLLNSPGQLFQSGSGFQVKDSGARIDYPSGMRRDTNENKTNFLLLRDGPMFKRLAEHLTKGAKKYGKRNWQLADSVDEYDRFRESACRHFEQWLDGDRDEDHAAAVIFNVNAAEYVRERLAA